MYCAVKKHSTAGYTACTTWPVVYLLSVPQLLKVAKSKVHTLERTELEGYYEPFWIVRDISRLHMVDTKFLQSVHT